MQIAADTKIPSYKQPVTHGVIKEDFKEFVENVMSFISQRDFVIEDEHASNREGSLFYYATFYPTDKSGNVLDKYLVFFGLSDHKIVLISKAKFADVTIIELLLSSLNDQKMMFKNLDFVIL